MDFTESIYTTGEFAELMNINKRTLHYYNDIGLFRPATTDENGYHRYAPCQAMDLELLLTLRKMGLSIDEIRKYNSHPSGESLDRLLKERKRMLEETMARLREEWKLLERKSQKLELSMKARHGLIEEMDLPEQYVHLSPSIEKKTEAETFDLISSFAQELRNRYGIYDNFGVRIKVGNVLKGAWDSYDALFSYADGSDDADDTLECGHWLRGYSIGRWDRLGEVYEKMLGYAEERGYTPVGYVYEEGLNEMSLGRDESAASGSTGYVTMILMHVVR